MRERDLWEIALDGGRMRVQSKIGFGERDGDEQSLSNKKLGFPVTYSGEKWRPGRMKAFRLKNAPIKKIQSSSVPSKGCVFPV